MNNPYQASTPFTPAHPRYDRYDASVYRYDGTGIPNLRSDGLEHSYAPQPALPPFVAPVPLPPPAEALPIQAIPQPTPRVAYEAPVFRTFQERRKAKATASSSGQMSAANTAAPPSRHHPAAAPPEPPLRTRTLPTPLVPNAARPLPQPRHDPSLRDPSTIRRQPPFPPVPVVLERSDTVSSIKSLDRSGFVSPSKRPLPKPPVVVNSSKSLDRGLPGGAGGLKGGMTRRQPSTVGEGSEGGEDVESAARHISPPALLTENTPDSVIPLVVEPPGSPGTPQITINFETDPENPHSPDIRVESPTDFHVETPRSRQIAFSGLPVIAVTTSGANDALPISANPGSDRPRIPTPGGETRIEPKAAITCAGCQHSIIGRIVSAMQQRWHPQCFMCAECGELLEHVSSYEWEGKPYCHLDYHDKFAHRCHHCKTPIVDPRFVTLNDEVLGQRYYHELHFFCSECGDPFLDPSQSSAPGTESNRLQEDDEGETNAFVIHRGHPYCERCHIRLHKPKCKACKQPIPDLAVSAMGAQWHQECFVCSACKRDFANHLFFPVNGEALCTECYEKVM